jgi:hypothetical protein
VDPLVIDSCHSTWLFDTANMRFRRILKGIVVADHPVTTGWRPYYGLETTDHSDGQEGADDPEGARAFVVLLNREGTRLIRSWRHTADCPQCHGRPVARLTSADIGSALV